MMDPDRLRLAEAPGAIAANIMPSMRGVCYMKAPAPLIPGAIVTVRIGDVASEDVIDALVGGAASAHMPRDLPPKLQAIAASKSNTDWRMLKLIAATAGDEIAVKRTSIAINGRRIARRFSRADLIESLGENTGAIWPLWTGTRTLSAGEVFLLSDPQDGFDERGCFDGRYYGPVSAHCIEETWSELTGEEIGYLAARKRVLGVHADK